MLIWKVDKNPHSQTIESKYYKYMYSNKPLLNGDY